MKKSVIDRNKEDNENIMNMSTIITQKNKEIIYLPLRFVMYLLFEFNQNNNMIIQKGIIREEKQKENELADLMYRSLR